MMALNVSYLSSAFTLEILIGRRTNDAAFLAASNLAIKLFAATTGNNVYEAILH